MFPYSLQTTSKSRDHRVELLFNVAGLFSGPTKVQGFRF